MFLISAALVLAGCDSASPLEQYQAANTETPSESPDAKLCEGLTTASESGHTSMRAAFISDPEGRDYGGGVINELTQAGNYRFLGGEMVGKTCYAYAEARGEQWGKTFNLAWRCPVKVLSDNPTEAGKTVLQVVEDRVCDYAVERGAPARREVEVELIHQ
ncbi:hypothetical protein [Sphingomonas radiodurans]|uniref:hypothetical protein n=1 Tax=Sphingomonas radiodurans TaxID=2890321 RepID=UPI001E3DBC81|nr:hypothetical protein [Sphingomonas radiodurans]WBH17637.1 hypothetical protein LLW23_05920 [Sphingomonas radiodurans]